MLLDNLNKETFIDVEEGKNVEIPCEGVTELPIEVDIVDTEGTQTKTGKHRLTTRRKQSLRESRDLPGIRFEADFISIYSEMLKCENACG